MRSLPAWCLMLVVGCGPTTWSELADSTDAAEIIGGIGVLEDHRAGHELLIGLLDHASPRVRARAALGLGRIEDAAGREPLERTLADPGPSFEVRRMAAFALGQLGDSASEPALIGRLGVERHPAIRLELWRALGRLGGEATLAASARAHGMDRPAGLVVAGLVARRMGRAAADVPHLVEALADDDGEARAAALYAFSRSTPGPLPDAARQAAARGLTSELGSERETAVRVLSRGCGGVLEAVRAGLRSPVLGAHQRAALLAGVARTEGEAATAALVAALRAELAHMPDPEALIRTRFHVVLAAARGLEGRTLGEEQREQLEEAWALVGARRGDAPIARRRSALSCALGVALGAPEVCPPWIRARLEGREGGDLTRLRALARHESARVRMAALEALAATGADVSADLRAALADPDLPVVAVAASAAATMELKDPEIGRALLAAWERAHRDGDLEVGGDLLRAMGTLEVAAVAAFEAALGSGQLALARLAAAELEKRRGERPEIARRPVPAFDRVALRSHSEERAPIPVAVETEVGTIHLELLPAWAPRTVDSFLRLAADGYFDGLTFHRVVQNFVIQGGDPRGDGWGGPGATLRCENNPLPYVTGSVGMALAGKDTGGSQWFITHAAQPHLLGTYPVFARVSRGQGVVDAIVEGDRILSVRRLD